MVLVQDQPFLELLLLTTSALIFDSPFNLLQLQSFIVDQCTTINPCKLILQFRFSTFVSVDSDTCPCSWARPHCCRNASRLNVPTSSCTHYITTIFRDHLYLPATHLRYSHDLSLICEQCPKSKSSLDGRIFPPLFKLKTQLCSLVCYFSVLQCCRLLLCPKQSLCSVFAFCYLLTATSLSFDTVGFCFVRNKDFIQYSPFATY